MSVGKIQRVTVCSKIPGLLEEIRSKTQDLVLEIRSVGPPLSNQVLIDTDILVADHDKLVDLINVKLTHVKWIQGTWAGVDALARIVAQKKVVPEFKLARFAHFNFSQLMAQWSLMGVLNIELYMKRLMHSQLSRGWDQDPSNPRLVRCISELKIGILGASGAMGRRTAQTFYDLGCRSIYGYVNTQRAGDKLVKAYCTGKHGLNWLLQQVDYVIAVLPSTPETDNILSLDMLSQCRNVGLVNMGRGNIVEEANVITALDNGWLRGAVLDVFDREPLPEDSPLWTHPKVIITPHVAATSRPQDISECFKSNLDAHLAGKEPGFLVDWNRLY